MVNFPRRGCEIMAKTCPEVRSCENGTARLTQFYYQGCTFNGDACSSAETWDMNCGARPPVSLGGYETKSRKRYIIHSADSKQNFTASIHPSTSLRPFFDPWPLFQFLDLFAQSVVLLGREISPSQGLYLHRGQHRNTE
jgi:hypothetical protein